MITLFKIKIKSKRTDKAYNLKSGLSLLELVIATAVFAASATISVGALLATSDAQRKVLASRIAQDNISYALDVISKDIRTGTSYHCGADISVVPQDCVSGDTSFTFINALGSTITYRINSQRLEKITDGVSMFLTSPDLIIINQLGFYVRGATAGDSKQPRVTIVLKGTAGIKEKSRSQISVQTTISQRSLDS